MHSYHFLCNGLTLLYYRPISFFEKVTKFIESCGYTSERILKDTKYLQQGFVPGRQLSETVIMLMVVLITESPEPAVTEMQSKAIIFLNSRKAYDTVDRY